MRLTASKLASPQSVKRAAFSAFAVAAIAGFAVASLASWWLLLIGVVAIAAAWNYTGGKNPYGYRGLGEISVFIFFGIVATVGTYFVQTEKITWAALAASIPMGSLSCALLAINNLRDRAQDVLVGKRTLAVRFGDKGARTFFAVLVLSAYLFALLTGHLWSLLTLATLPLALPLIQEILNGATGVALIPLLAKTGKLQLSFAAIFAVALSL